MFYFYLHQIFQRLLSYSLHIYKYKLFLKEGVDWSEAVDGTEAVETLIPAAGQVGENRSENMETRINGIRVSTLKQTCHEKLRNIIFQQTFQLLRTAKLA